MLRIIAGKHRGRRIETKRSASIRPTGAKARGAIFNILMHGRFNVDGQSALVGKDVLDLFCGTGALGLEALSRGARYVTFVDQSAESIGLARENASTMGEEANTHFIRSDSTSLPKARKPCHVVFIDPPYNSGLAIKAMHSMHVQGWLAPEALVIVEISVREKMLAQEGYELVDEREYGNTKIVFFRYKR